VGHGEDLWDTRGAKRQKSYLKNFLARSFSPTFASLKNNAVAAFSTAYIYIIHTYINTHTRCAADERRRRKTKGFYPLGDGTIESSPHEKKKKKRRKKKGERERERELRELKVRIHIYFKKR